MEQSLFPNLATYFSESKCSYFWGVPTLEETFFARPTFRKNLGTVSSTVLSAKHDVCDTNAVPSTMLPKIAFYA